MFKVGMGVSPSVPDTLSEEGQQFVDNCLQHNPYTRATVSELLEHNFIKVFSFYYKSRIVLVNKHIYNEHIWMY